MKNIFVERDFGIIDCTLFKTQAFLLGANEDYIDKFETIIRDFLDDKMKEAGDVYFVESILAFYYSYKYRFEKKLFFNSYIYDNHKLWGLNSGHYAQTFIHKNRKDICERSLLYDFFSDTLNSISKKKKPSLPELDGNVLIYSLVRYETIRNVKKSFESFKDFISEGNFNLVDKNIFEKIYHPILISEILKFYYDFKKLINMLNDELFYRNDAESIEYLNFNTVYFNVTKVVQVIRKDAWENFLNCDSVKRKYMYKLEEFCKVLCRLSGFCNVYHIKEIVTTFINSNIENIADEKSIVASINKCMTKEYLQSYTTTELFYYFSMYMALLNYTGKESYEDSFSTLIKDENYCKNPHCFLTKYIKKIEKSIPTWCRDLSIENCCDNISDDDNMFPKLAGEIYVISHTCEKTNFDPKRLYDNEYFADYRNLLEKVYEKTVFYDKLQDFTKQPYIMYKPDSNSKLQVTIVSPDAESQTNKAKISS